MNAFDAASGVEAKGMAILLPYLEEIADGRLVLTAKGTLSRYLQLTVGDALINDRQGRVWTIEMKIEEKHTGNIFLETWSNRNLDKLPSYSERGCNPGWMIHSRSEVLLYYFLDTDDLYVINLFKLKQWAFGCRKDPGHIYEHVEIRQGKYIQMNDTWGRLVSIATLRESIGLSHCKVKQLALWNSMTDPLARAEVERS